MANKKGTNRRNNTKRKPKRLMAIPLESYDNKVLKDFERLFPSLKCLTTTEEAELTSRIQKLMQFESQARIPYTAAKYISRWISGKPEFEERDLLDEINHPSKSRKMKYFFKDPWDGDSMMIVKEGQLDITYGFNLLITHSDSPCLRIKSKPVRLEWTPDKQYNYPGTRLSATAHGGLVVSQWPGQDVYIQGYSLDKKGNKTFHDIPAIIPGSSAHTDHTKDEVVSDAFKSDLTFEVIAGHTSLQDTLDKFGFESIDDFGQAKLFVVPTTNPIAIDEETWRLLSAYGHDNRATTYTAVSAITRVRQPRLTSIVWITDNEEVGNIPPSGVEGPFLDFTLDYLFERYERGPSRRGRRKPLSDRDKRTILLKSSFIYADVNVAPFGYDAEYEHIDADNSPKLGLGVAIQTGTNYVSSMDFARKLKNYATRQSKQGNNICHQIVGQVYHQDWEDVWWYENFQKGILRYFGQWANSVGIPCASTHNPKEVISPGDEYAAYKFFRRFLQSNTGIGYEVKELKENLK